MWINIISPRFRYSYSSLETMKSPFESNESVFISTDNRATTRRKRERRDGYRKGVHKYRSKTLDYEKQNDSDIQMDIDRYGSDKYNQRRT